MKDSKERLIGGLREEINKDSLIRRSDLDLAKERISTLKGTPLMEEEGWNLRKCWEAEEEDLDLKELKCSRRRRESFL